MGNLKNLDPQLLINLKDDLFKESKFISRLYKLIVNEVTPPYAIAIDGDWGTGKTQTMLLLKRSFDNAENSTRRNQ